MTAAATTVFPARRVITMEPSSPDATAVAVTGEMVTAVGSFAKLTDRADAAVDETYAGRWFPASG